MVWSIRYEFDILKADDLITAANFDFRVTRCGVDDLGGVERERLANHAPPAKIVAARDNLCVGSWRARAQQEWVLELHSVHGNRQIDSHTRLTSQGYG